MEGGIIMYVRGEVPFHKTLMGLKSRLMDENFAQAMYAALCNMQWQPIGNSDEEQVYSCSWRYAGGLIAGIRRNGEDYLDFYCSGIGDGDGVSEGHVTEEIKDALKAERWEPLPYEEE